MRFTLLFSLLISGFCFSADFELLREQAESGDPTAQYQIALLFQEGSSEISPSIEDAAYWYQQAANNKHSNAQIALANLYLKGLGVETSVESALFWLTNAATTNNPKAQYLLGNLYENLDENPEALKLAELWYEKASLQNQEAELAYSRLLEQNFNNRRAKQVAAIDQLEEAFESAPIELSAKAESLASSQKQRHEVVYGLVAVIALLTATLIWMFKRIHTLKLATSSEQSDSQRHGVKLAREMKRKEETIQQQKKQLETMFKHIKKLQLANKQTSSAAKSDTSKEPARKESPLSLACALFGFKPDAIPDQKQIKVRYKQLSKIYHPDLKGSDEEMKRLNQALKIILKQVS